MKRNNPNDKSLPDMGQIVTGLLDGDHMFHTTLAKKAGWSDTTICKLLKKRNWNALELRQVGRAIDVDLFAYYQPKPEEPMVPLSQLTEVLEQKLKLQDELDKTKIDFRIMEGKYMALKEALGK